MCSCSAAGRTRAGQLRRTAASSPARRFRARVCSLTCASIAGTAPVRQSHVLTVEAARKVGRPRFSVAARASANEVHVTVDERGGHEKNGEKIVISTKSPGSTAACPATRRRRERFAHGGLVRRVRGGDEPRRVGQGVFARGRARAPTEALLLGRRQRRSGSRPLRRPEVRRVGGNRWNSLPK